MTEYPQPAVVAPLAIFEIDGQRDPCFGRHREIEAFAHDANDSKTPSADFDVLADNVRIRRVALLPKRVPENDFLFFSRCLFLGKKTATELRLYSQHLEQVRRNLESLDLFRTAVAGQVDLIP